MPEATIQITIPQALLESIDSRIGVQNRSRFFADLAKRELPVHSADAVDILAWKPDPGKRFNPVPIKGESVAATLLRDRGDY